MFFIKSQLITLQGFEARLNFTPVNLQCKVFLSRQMREIHKNLVKILELDFYK